LTSGGHAMPSIRSRRPGRVRNAVAAGGVVVREREGKREVVLTGRHSDGTWVFPKGTPDRGEEIEDTALREVEEETGLKVRILAPIGTTDYWFAAPGERVHKFVHFFLMEPTGGDVSRHDHEYDEVRWVPADEARRLLSFDTYRDLVDRLVSSDIAGLAIGEARYGLLCNEGGTIVDDVIVYRTGETEFLMVVNAANIAKDRAHVLRSLGDDAAFDDRSLATALIAVQGPRAAEILDAQTGSAVSGLASFGVARRHILGHPDRHRVVNATVARTGYTGEDGFEIFVAKDDAITVWDAMLDAGRDARHK